MNYYYDNNGIFNGWLVSGSIYIILIILYYSQP